MSKYTFNVKLNRCAIDTNAAYGYWEHADGSEGGGLWFTGGSLEDFDGAYELPAAVIAELRAAGFHVGEGFEPEAVQS